MARVGAKPRRSLRRLLSPQECEPATLLEMDVTAEKLPWASELTENQEENKVTKKLENVIRDHTLAVGPGVQWLNGSTDDHGIGEPYSSTVGAQ